MGAPRAYLGAFAVHGTAVMLLGPSISTLHATTGISTARLGLLFSAVSVGYLLGVVASGRLVEHTSVHRVLAAGLVTMGAAVVFVPHAASLAALVVLEFGIGCGIGLLEVPCNSAILWTRGGGALLNALHAAYAVGAILGPLVVGRSLAWTGGLTTGYSLVAVVSLLPLVLLRRGSAPTNPHTAARRGVPAGSRRIVAVITAFFLAYVGAEATFSGWIYRYGELRHVVRGAAAPFLGAAFLAAFAVGRLSGIVVSQRLGALAMLHVDHVVAALGVVVLAVGHSNAMAVWIGTALVGLGVASMFASMLGVAEECAPTTGTITSIYLVGASVGGIVIAGSMGAAFDEWGAGALLWVVGVSLATTWAIVTVLDVTARRRESPASS